MSSCFILTSTCPLTDWDWFHHWGLTSVMLYLLYSVPRDQRLGLVPAVSKEIAGTQQMALLMPTESKHWSHALSYRLLSHVEASCQNCMGSNVLCATDVKYSQLHLFLYLQQQYNAKRNESVMSDWETEFTYTLLTRNAPPSSLWRSTSDMY